MIPKANFSLRGRNHGRPPGLRMAAPPQRGGKCWPTPALSNGRLYVRSTTEGACLDLAGKLSPPAEKIPFPCLKGAAV